MNNSKEWEIQAKAYEAAQTEDNSLDTLIEYPAQLEAIGSVKGKAILDIAGGSGRKAFDLVKAGAATVYSFDITDQYERPWGDDKNRPSNLTVFQCDLNGFWEHPLLIGKKFDIVLSLMASGYPEKPLPIYMSIRNALKENGRFIYATAHPMRYAVERSEKESIGIANAYHKPGSYSYAGTWNSDVTSVSFPKTISEQLSLLIQAGFKLEGINEPFISQSDAEKYPEKQKWMERYFGIIIYKLQACNK